LTRPSESPLSGEPAVIEVENLYFAYPGHLVLADINFTVRRGEFVSIIGPSGCGKSTLLTIMAGLLRPSRGSIRVNGRAVSGPREDWAMVFQHFALLPWRTAIDNVRMGMQYRRGRSKREQKQVANRYLTLVGLEGFEHHYPHQLSGGMRQRVGLARAFAAHAPILLMDEPFASIDAQHAELMREELRDLIARENRSIVFITHNLDEALFLSDRILVLSANPGTVVKDVQIDLPQPRGFEVADEAERLRYAQYRAGLWAELRVQIRRADS